MGIRNWARSANAAIGNAVYKTLFRPQAKAVTDELGVGAVLNRWSDYPSFNLTPQQLRQILWQADQGSMRYLMELYEEMEEKDAHLAAILQTRKLAVQGLPLEVQPASEDARDQEIAQFVEEQLLAIPDFKGDLMDLLDAIAKSYSAAEIFWEYRNKQAVVADLEWIHPKCVSFVNSPTPLIITADNGSGITPPPWKIIFHRYRGRSGDVCRGGVLRTCTLPYLLKSFNWKFWAIFNELFGIPMRIGKYDASASEQDRDHLKEALKSMGTDAYAAISKNMEIEFKETTAGSGGKLLPHQALIQFCNNEMSKAVLGQTLTTDTTGATGTYAAGAVHEQVRQDLVVADAGDLAAVLRDQLVRPLVGFNFGWDAPLPKVLLVIQEAIDLKTESEAVKNFVDAGLSITEKHCYQRYGFPQPEEGEKVLQPQVNIRPGAEIPPGPPLPKGGESPAAMKAQTGHAETLASQKAAAVQQELDNLTQAASQEAQRYLAKMLQPVAHLVESGASLEVIKGKLLELYSRIDTRDLEVLMGQVRILANLRGRVNG